MVLPTVTSFLTVFRMSKESKEDAQVTTHAVKSDGDGTQAERENHRALLQTLHKADNRMLAELGYKAEFKREFSVRTCFKRRSRTWADGNIS